MYLVLGKVLQQQRDFVEAELSEINDSILSLDSVDEEIKQMEQALNRPPTEMDPSAEVLAAFSPLQ
jgi:prefoldin subunit 5